MAFSFSFANLRFCIEYEIHEKNTRIFFASEVTAHIKENDDQTLIEDIVFRALEKGVLIDNESIGFIDSTENLFIEAKLDGDNVLVYYVAKYQE